MALTAKCESLAAIRVTADCLFRRTFAPSLKLVAKMLTLGIAQTSLALLSLNRIFAPSKQKKGNSNAFHRSRLSQSLLAHMALLWTLIFFAGIVNDEYPIEFFTRCGRNKTDTFGMLYHANLL